MRLLLIATLLLATVAAVDADQVHARLIRATNKPVGADPRLADIVAPLGKQFGYKYYRQLGNAQLAWPAGGQQRRLDVGEGFTVFVTPQAASGPARELAVEWYSGKTMLAKWVAKLPPGGHVFAGPVRVGEDWLVLALTRRE